MGERNLLEDVFTYFKLGSVNATVWFANASIWTLSDSILKLTTALLGVILAAYSIRFVRKRSEFFSNQDVRENEKHHLEKEEMELSIKLKMEELKNSKKITLKKTSPVNVERKKING